MNHPKEVDFYDPTTGGRAFRLRKTTFEDVFKPRRCNYFSIYRILSGHGVIEIDEASLRFADTMLLFVVPYQYVCFDGRGKVELDAIDFHANFLCIETFHAEAGCAGSLFNDPYGLPSITPKASENPDVHHLFRQIEFEVTQTRSGYKDAALAILKLLLIRLSRMKTPSRDGGSALSEDAYRHPVLALLGEIIDQNFHQWHSPSDYARALKMSVKTLGRLVRKHLGLMPTDLIRRRILTHAKWQLLHTRKSVKEIAAELGYEDEFYFSRFFKKGTGVSPKYFRDFETTIRGGSNLSMP